MSSFSKVTTNQQQIHEKLIKIVVGKRRTQNAKTPSNKNSLIPRTAKDEQGTSNRRESSPSFHISWTTDTDQVLRIDGFGLISPPL